MSTGVAVASVIGGGYVTVVTGLGLLVFASESYPLVFGIDHWGDRQYPFPAGSPLLPLLGLVLMAAGVGFGAVLVRVSQGEMWARRLAIGAFLVVVGVAAAASYGISHERRCAVIEYSNVDRCMSRPAAAARDFIPLGLPAVIAAVLLAREPTG